MILFLVSVHTHMHSLCFGSDDLYNMKVVTSLVKVSGLLIQYFSCSQLIFAQPVNSQAYCTHNVNICLYTM